MSTGTGPSHSISVVVLRERVLAAVTEAKANRRPRQEAAAEERAKGRTFEERRSLNDISQHLFYALEKRSNTAPKEGSRKEEDDDKSRESF
jgi:hypothetical protein